MAKTKVHGEFLKDSVVRFTAKAGENITKGQAVYISGISGEVPVVSLADADDTNKMPAFGLAEATVSTNAEVEITSFGTLKGLDTSSYSLGDILYVHTTAGALTNNPSGLEATKLQNIGMVQRVHASSGSIKVGGAGRTNAVPNLDDGDIFIGDSNNKAISSSFTAVLNSEAGINSSADATAITIDSSENVGIGGSTITDVNLLNIQGSGASKNIGVVFNDTNTSKIFSIQNGGSALKFFDYTASAERLRIDSSGNVGIGHNSPGGFSSGANNLVVNDAAGAGGITIVTPNDAKGSIFFADGTGATGQGRIRYNHDGDYMTFGTSGSEDKLVIDSSGAVGIGQVPETARWSGHDILQVGGRATFLGNDTVTSTGQTALLDNLYYDASGNFQHRGDSRGVAMQFVEGQVIFSNSNQTTGTPTVSERMRIKSDGAIGFGTNNPFSYGGKNFEFQDTSTDQTGVRFTSSASSFEIGSDANGGYLQAITPGDGISFYSANSSAADIQAIRILANGNVGIGTTNPTDKLHVVGTSFLNGNTYVGSGGAGNLYLSAGTGIYMDGGTGSANHLDDYEEGTWTPTITTGSGSVTLDSSENLASYTKVGRMVYITGRLHASSVSSPSGSLEVTNLPFTVLNLGENSPSSPVVINLYNLASNISGQINAEMSTGNSILIRDNGATTGNVQNTMASHITSGSRIGFTAVYVTSQ